MEQLQETQRMREVGDSVDGELGKVGTMFVVLRVAKIVDCKRSGIQSRQKSESKIMIVETSWTSTTFEHFFSVDMPPHEYAMEVNM
jgi:hypothetical protein